MPTSVYESLIARELWRRARPRRNLVPHITYALAGLAVFTGFGPEDSGVMPLKECLEEERKLCFVGFASPKRGVGR